LKALLLVSILILTSCASNKKDDDRPIHEKKASIYYGYGTHHLVKKQYTKALKNLMEANRLNPNDTKIHNNLGMAYYFKKNPDRAIRHIKKAIELDKKNTDARINLATIYLQQNKLNKAEDQYKLVLEDLVYEGQYKTYYNLGLLALKRNQKLQAINYFKQSINLMENYCPSHYQMGRLSYQAGSYSKALEHFKSAGLGTCYNNPKPFYMQALTYIKMGKFEMAQNRLDDVMGRFDNTRYSALAKQKTTQIRNMTDFNTQDKVEARLNLQEDLSTPDF
jgi:type IV pilus assembly protein PilF